MLEKNALTTFYGGLINFKSRIQETNAIEYESGKSEISRKYLLKFKKLCKKLNI